MSYTRDVGEVTGRYRSARQVGHSILRAGTVARYVATGAGHLAHVQGPGLDL